MADDSATNLRTPGGLAVETVTNHLFAVASYAYTATLQNRPTRTSLHTIRVLLFLFIPTLIIVELAGCLIRALVQFIRNQIDEEEKNFWFHLSAGMGLHAAMPITNHTTKQDEIHKISLLELDPTATDRERIGWSWPWAGKLLITLFTFIQALGSIILYARRVGNNYPLGLDHRNGAMAIGSTICSVTAVIVLFLRFQWTVPRALQTASTDKLHDSFENLILHFFLALGLHHLIAYIINENNEWLYTSSGVAFVLSGFFIPGRRRHVLAGWQNILLVALVVIFRKDIASRLGLDSGRYQTWIRHRSWLRIKALLKLFLVAWFLVDLGRRLGIDIADVVDKREDEDYWWQDPLAGKIFST
jgi:hypothetical protein